MSSFFIFLFGAQLALSAPLTKVRIDFVEALSPKDTTSSERYKSDYQRAIDLGKQLTQNKLAKCGYELESVSTFYESSDALKGKEIAQKINNSGSWLIVGPRRSNHYLLLAQGSGKTPTVSLMASADSVSELAPIHTSISPTNSEMAGIAAKEIKRKLGKNATYVSMVSDDCTSCVDFEKAFDIQAKALGLKQLEHLSLSGESFETKPVIEAIQKHKPKFVLLPNYSKVVARVMGALNNDTTPPYFVGGDGWGDQKYGFVQTEDKIERVKGFTVRGFPPIEKGLQDFPLGKQALKHPNELPFASPSLGTLKILENVVQILCSTKPKNAASFSEKFTKQSKKALHAPWGISLYELSDGKIEFNRTVRGRK